MNDRPWLKSYPDEVPHSLEPYPEKSLFSMFEEVVSTHGDRPAISFPVAPMSKTLTYRQLMDEVEQFSRVLASFGIGRGDRVGFVLPNCPQYVVAFYACLRLGAIAVGNNPLSTEREIIHQLKDSGVDTVLVLDVLYPMIGKVRDETGLKTVIVCKIGDYLGFPINKLAPIKQKKEAKHEGREWPPVPAEADVLWWDKLMKGNYPDIAPAEVSPKEDVGALLYTGGTTGLPKGAMLTHYNMVSNVLQVRAWFAADIEEGKEAMMCVLPFFHSYGLQAVLNVAISAGGKCILLPRFELDMVLEAIDKEKPTLFPGVPRIYVAINDSDEHDKHDLSSIRACFSGAAPLRVDVAEKFEALTGGRLVEGYGLTETSPVTHINPVHGKRKFGSIGLPIPDTQCKLVDLDDPNKEVGPDEEGELVIAGPQIMKGYWNKKEATDEMIRTDENGIRWLHTGDIAKMDDEGYFSIVDRKKDMIIVSGFNVYPSDVEDVLNKHEKVAKSAVIGIPDDKTGEAVKAFIVLKKGQDAKPEEIIEWAKDKKEGLSGYRVPKHVEFRDELPETMIGKVLRRELVKEEKEKAEARG